MNDVPVESAEILEEIGKRLSGGFMGQDDIIRQTLVALLSNGHILLEGVPGLGKTLLVRLLSRCFDGTYQRIQFTPDLMPADITGHSVYDMNRGEFRTRRGPVFTNILLADEINRAPAKSQAALLEVMQERQVTIDGECLRVPGPFMVLATQNPIEQEGTYALPESELDRFLMKVNIDYPDHEDEIRITTRVSRSADDDILGGETSAPLLDAERVAKLQRQAADITVDDSVVDYAVRIVRATRDTRALNHGAGPRASIALVRCARAAAMLRGAQWTLPDDVKAYCLPVLRHRVTLSPEVEIQGLTVDDILRNIVDGVDAPRE
jgi:MoxR-like ATPase